MSNGHRHLQVVAVTGHSHSEDHEGDALRSNVGALTTSGSPEAGSTPPWPPGDANHPHERDGFAALRLWVQPPWGPPGRLIPVELCFHQAEAQSPGTLHPPPAPLGAHHRVISLHMAVDELRNTTEVVFWDPAPELHVPRQPGGVFYVRDAISLKTGVDEPVIWSRKSSPLVSISSNTSSEVSSDDNKSTDNGSGSVRGGITKYWRSLWLLRQCPRTTFSVGFLLACGLFLLFSPILRSRLCRPQTSKSPVRTLLAQDIRHIVSLRMEAIDSLSRPIPELSLPGESAVGNGSRRVVAPDLPFNSYTGALSDGGRVLDKTTDPSPLIWKMKKLVFEIWFVTDDLVFELPKLKDIKPVSYNALPLEPLGPGEDWKRLWTYTAFLLFDAARAWDEVESWSVLMLSDQRGSLRALRDSILFIPVRFFDRTVAANVAWKYHRSGPVTDVDRYLDCHWCSLGMSELDYYHPLRAQPGAGHPTWHSKYRPLGCEEKFLDLAERSTTPADVEKYMIEWARANYDWRFNRPAGEDFQPLEPELQDKLEAARGSKLELAGEPVPVAAARVWADTAVAIDEFLEVAHNLSIQAEGKKDRFVGSRPWWHLWPWEETTFMDRFGVGEEQRLKNLAKMRQELFEFRHGPLRGLVVASGRAAALHMTSCHVRADAEFRFWNIWLTNGTEVAPESPHKSPMPTNPTKSQPKLFRSPLEIDPLAEIEEIYSLWNKTRRMVSAAKAQREEARDRAHKESERRLAEIDAKRAKEPPHTLDPDMPLPAFLTQAPFTRLLQFHESLSDSPQTEPNGQDIDEGSKTSTSTVSTITMMLDGPQG